ncbi:hypothetical protein Brms1b_005706 [Colletotrichum noveboracense]|nr:hypothetical protein Brms1b_005706 [Colletotrichum noveboracense]
MTPVQDIPSNGNDLVDSLDRLKVDDGEPRLGRVVTMEKINHNGLANGKTMGYSNGEKMKKDNGNDLADGKTMGYNVRRGSFFTSSDMSHEFAAQQRIKLTDNTEIPPPVLTTIIGDDGFTDVLAESLGRQTCRALREICIPFLFRKVRIYRAEYRAIQPLKAMLLNDRIQRSMITYGLRASYAVPPRRSNEAVMGRR